MYQLKSESSFDAAHFLTDYNGKCENLHGHRWRVIAYIGADALQEKGDERDMVCDFSAFKAALREITGEFDHMFLVEEGSLAEATINCLRDEEFDMVFLPFRTTTENLAKYFFERLAQAGFQPTQVEVYETPNNCAIYSPVALGK